MAPKGGYGRGGKKSKPTAPSNITMVLEPGTIQVEGSMARNHVLQIGSQAGSPNFGRLWIEDFESYSVGEWTSSNTDLIPETNHYYPDILTQPYDHATSGLGAAVGTKFCSTNINQSEQGAYTAVCLLQSTGISHNEEFLIRWYARADEDVDQSRGGTDGDGYKFWRVGYNGPNYSDDTSTCGNSNNAAILNWVFFTSGGDGASDFSINPCPLWDNQWHKIEIYFKDTTSGIIKVWIDDVLKFNWDPVNLRGVTDGLWDSFNMPSNFVDRGSGFPTGDNHFYIDSFEVFSDTGTGGYGSMSDGTASNTPV